MNHSCRKIATTLAFVVLVVAKNTFAQTVANGPYYAVPSWDQTLSASSRFVVLANFKNNAVLDRETGLVWQRRLTDSLKNFALAYDECLQAKTGNRMGWRLPTVAELLSLFDPEVEVPPFLPAEHPFLDFGTGGVSRQLYTATTVPSGDPDAHFYVALSSPLKRATAFRERVAAGQPRALCVRSGGTG